MRTSVSATVRPRHRNGGRIVTLYCRFNLIRIKILICDSQDFLLLLAFFVASHFFMLL